MADWLVIKPGEICGIIPARWDSTRFPGKVLTPIRGWPLLAWVIQGCLRSRCVRRWIVATDDRRIAEVARQAGAEVAMTPTRLRSGSDRVAKVAAGLRVQWIVNWQGDEWLPDGRPVDLLVKTLETHPECPVATLARPMAAAEATNPNRVKVVVSQTGRALYFSRALIPHGISGTKPAWLHLGAYAFERRALLQFTAWRQTPLEKQEKLEQLRLLEHDVPVAVSTCSVQTISVDMPADSQVLAERLARSRRRNWRN